VIVSPLAASRINTPLSAKPQTVILFRQLPLKNFVNRSRDRRLISSGSRRADADESGIGPMDLRSAV
jgi:hypothetical protein